jgi:hypothetical protein
MIRIYGLACPHINVSHLHVHWSYVVNCCQWRTHEYLSGGGCTPGIFSGGSTNSVEDGGQRERESGGGSLLVRGSTQFANA